MKREWWWVVFILYKSMLAIDWLIMSAFAIDFAPSAPILLSIWYKWVIGKMIRNKSQFKREWWWVVFILITFILTINWLILSASTIDFTPSELILLPVVQVSN
jgi:hypothetical protein